MDGVSTLHRKSARWQRRPCRCLAHSMKPPKRLQPLIDEGLIDEVSRQLMSGKEAIVYVVRSGDDVRCAKVYKEANCAAFTRPSPTRKAGA